jgi:carbonic anhydrase
VASNGTYGDVLAANAKYAEDFALGRLDAVPMRRLAVLTCLDTRIDPLSQLGLDVGEAAVLRNAGGRVNDDVITSLVMGRYLLEIEKLMVIAHTGCRLTVPSQEALRAAISAAGGPETSGFDFATAADPAARVRADVEQVRARTELAGLEVGGFLYEVETGRLTQLC